MSVNPALLVGFALLLATMGVVVLAPSPAADQVCAPVPPDLQPGHESGRMCRLHVLGGPETVVDRGSLGCLSRGVTFVGAFRYWDEPGGRMLYLYDDVQNFVARVVNPRTVVLDPASPTP